MWPMRRRAGPGGDGLAHVATGRLVWLVWLGTLMRLYHPAQDGSQALRVLGEPLPPIRNCGGLCLFAVDTITFQRSEGVLGGSGGFRGK